MRNVGASTPCTVTCTAGSSVSALVGIKGGREVGMEGARSKVGEGAPLGVERECGQCGIGSGGIGSSGIRQQRYPHGGVAGLVFGETQNWFLMCAYGDPYVDIPVRWVLISRCCLLLEKNVVCLVVCSRTSFWKNVSTVLHVRVEYNIIARTCIRNASGPAPHDRHPERGSWMLWMPAMHPHPAPPRLRGCGVAIFNF